MNWFTALTSEHETGGKFAQFCGEDKKDHAALGQE